MIEHELMLLGMLKERPKHGYEIKKEIKEALSLFAGITPKSIYYPLRILEKKGMVLKSLSRQKRRPYRIVYRLTQKGAARFKELLTNSLLDFKRPEFSLDISLYFLNYLEPEIAKRRLRARKQVLEGLAGGLCKSIKNLKNYKKPSSIIRILEHNLKMVESESRFLSQLNKAL